jgi:hypothetical protein
MTVLTPPAYLQAGTYTAVHDRQYLVSSLFYPYTDNLRARGGILPNSTNVNAGLGVSGLNVSIGGFRAIVRNDNATGAGDYHVVSLNTETRTMGASSPTLNRIDTIGVLVRDSFYSGSFADSDIVILPGTPVAGTPSPPVQPVGFLPLYNLTLNANATTPTVTDLRKGTALTGATIIPFGNQLTDAGMVPGEVMLMPAAGVMPAREKVWGTDGLWHGTQPFVVDMGAWVITSSTADRIIASLSVPDPGYAYRLFWSGAVWASFDGLNGWRFVPRQGTTAGGTPLGGQGGWETRDPSNVFTGENSVPITGASGNLTGAQTISLWAQRKFGAGTQGCAIGAVSQVQALVVPV